MKAVVISLHILLLSCQCEGFNLCKHQTQLSKVVLIPRCLCYPCTTHSLSLWQAWLNETSLFCATTVRTKAFVLSHTSQNWDVNAELLWFCSPSLNPGFLFCRTVSLGSIHISAALMPALPLKSYLDCSWATCSLEAISEPDGAAAGDCYSAFLILGQAFVCLFCVNPGTLQLLDVELSFQVIRAFFLNLSLSR